MIKKKINKNRCNGSLQRQGLTMGKRLSATLANPELSKTFTSLQIVQIVVMLIRLPLVRDVHITFIETSVLNASVKQFQNVDNVKGKEQHLLLLAKMYSLVILDILVYPVLPAAQYHPKK